MASRERRESCIFSFVVASYLCKPDTSSSPVVERFHILVLTGKKLLSAGYAPMQSRFRCLSLLQSLWLHRHLILWFVWSAPRWQCFFFSITEPAPTPRFHVTGVPVALRVCFLRGRSKEKGSATWRYGIRWHQGFPIQGAYLLLDCQISLWWRTAWTLLRTISPLLGWNGDCLIVLPHHNLKEKGSIWFLICTLRPFDDKLVTDRDHRVGCWYFEEPRAISIGNLSLGDTADCFHKTGTPLFFKCNTFYIADMSPNPGSSSRRSPPNAVPKARESTNTP